MIWQHRTKSNWWRRLLGRGRSGDVRSGETVEEPRTGSEAAPSPEAKAPRPTSSGADDDVTRAPESGTRD